MTTETNFDGGDASESMEKLRKDILEQRDRYEAQLSVKDVQIRLKEKLVQESHRKFAQSSAKIDMQKDLIDELKQQVARYKTLYASSSATQHSKLENLKHQVKVLQRQVDSPSKDVTQAPLDSSERVEPAAETSSLEEQLEEKLTLEIETNKLRTENGRLRRQLTEQKVASEKKVDALEQEMREAEAAHRASLEKTKFEMKKMRKSYKRQQEELNESASRFEELHSLLDEKEEELSESLQTSEADVPALRRDLKATEELLDERASRIAELEQWLEEALGDLEHKDQQFEAREANLNAHLEQIEQQTSRLREQLDTKEESIAQIENKLADKERELADVEQNTVHRDRFAHLQHELDETKKRYSDMKSELRRLKGDACTSPETSPTKASPVTPNASISNGSIVTLSPIESNEVALLKRQLLSKQDECDEANKELLETRGRMATLQLQIEEMEHEQAFGRAKLSELSNMLTSRKDAEQQLFEKSVECADVTTRLQTMQQKLKTAESKVKMLEQENKLTKELVDNLNRSWEETLPGSGPDLQSIKREHDESLTRATELSIQLAEAQMKIDSITDDNKKLTRRSSEYAKQLSALSNTHAAQQGGFFGRLIESSKQERELASTVQKLKQRIEVLENENAAYMASLSAIKMDMQTATS